jgi:tetraacyldisaccharide 4'-kinase
MRNDSTEQYILRVMSGRKRGLGATALRAILSLGEPVYSAFVNRRNHRFDAGKNVRKLPRPVVSVGNLTAGGTGKTPVVRWLTERLRAARRHPAILLRGYKSVQGVSDERRMLEASLNVPGQTPIVVHVNPDRFLGGSEVLREHPEVDVFVLDDGFQHRRLARDFDLVLINAAEPFGFGHLHPRGLLREPLTGLKRAHAAIITRVDEAPPAAIAEIERRIREHNSAVPIFHSCHAHVRLKSPEGLLAIEALADRKVFAFCGIGDPESFFRQVKRRAGTLVGSRAFADHHAYRDLDLVDLSRAAETAGAEILVTTEKDWTKLNALTTGIALPLFRVEMAIQFREGDEEGLLKLLP